MVAAPGRLNLMGDHTDYEGGLALPMAINRWLVVAAGTRGGGVEATPRGHVWTNLDPEGAEFDGDDPPRRGVWTDYVAGVLHHCWSDGIRPAPFDAAICSEIPAGAGLSSSAALEVGIALALEALSGSQRSPLERARICRRAEHDFAGVPCGPMDQITVAMARPGHALLIDCASEAVEPVPFSDGEACVLVIDSQVRHTLTDGSYARRRRECREAALALGVETLRKAADGAWNGGLSPLLAKRVRHVVTENQRTLESAEAIRRGDWDHLGQLMLASHDSLSRDFEVSCDELDTLVELARARRGRGILGARMTGGGFGGSVIVLAKREDAPDLGAELCAAYERATGLVTSAFLTAPAGAASIVSEAP